MEAHKAQPDDEINGSGHKNSREIFGDNDGCQYLDKRDINCKGCADKGNNAAPHGEKCNNGDAGKRGV